MIKPRHSPWLFCVKRRKELIPAKYAEPQIYVNDIFEENKKCKDLKEALEMAAQAMIDAYRNKIENQSRQLFGKVDKKQAKKIKMKESELYDAVIINTKKWFPPTIKSMNEVLCGYLRL